MAARQKGKNAPRRGSSSNAAKLNRLSLPPVQVLGPGLIVLVLATLALLVAFGPLAGVASSTFNWLLRSLGLSPVILAGWAVAVGIDVRKGPITIVLHGNRWLGSLLIAGAVLGGLSFFAFTLTLLGQDRVLNLGGELVGGGVRGSESWPGVLRIIVLALVGGALWSPLRAWRLTRLTLSSLRRGIRTAIAAYRSHPLHPVILQGARLVAQTAALAFTAIVSTALAALSRRRTGSQARVTGEPAVVAGRMVATPVSPPTPRSSEMPEEPYGGEGERDDAGAAELASPEARRTPSTKPPKAERRAATQTSTGTTTGLRKLPSLDLLEPGREVEIPQQVLNTQSQRIKQALAEYGIDVTVRDIRPGPTVTLYGLEPGWVRRRGQKKAQTQDAESERRVTVDAILAREKDLALALAAPSLRFEAPVPGASVVGVEVPNPEPSPVALRTLLEGSAFHRAQSKGTLPIALGKGSGDEVVIADLASMPHLLVAGSTGSGKSVCVHSILTSLLMQHSPWSLRMILIDPKRVELTHYNGIPHLVTPVIVEADEAVKALRGAVLEMGRRLHRLEEAGARNIASFNAKEEDPAVRMPYLVIVVDEMADLMMAAANEIEQTLCRLAQLGRATGIHLVVATQRPSVDVITGLIKANFPSRLSFAVASHTDSKTILDVSGAEKLLGRGDMLFYPQDFPKPKRAQAAYLSDEEVGRLVEFWETTDAPPPPAISLEPAAHETGETGLKGTVGGDHDGDTLLEQAQELAQRYSRVSTSLLQRRLRIGYPRAARLREELQEIGAISPDGEVLLSSREDGE